MIFYGIHESHESMDLFSDLGKSFTKVASLGDKPLILKWQSNFDNCRLSSFNVFKTENII